MGPGARPTSRPPPSSAAPGWGALLPPGLGGGRLRPHAEGGALALGARAAERRFSRVYASSPVPSSATASLSQALIPAHGGEWGSMEEVYDALALRLLNLAHSTPPGGKTLVALAGPPGAGKSTVAEVVVRRVNDPEWRRAAECGRGRSGSEVLGQQQGEVGEEEGEKGEMGGKLAVAVPMDGFHLYRWQLDCLPNPKLAHLRRGAPWTFDPAALFRFLKRISEQGRGFLPSFDHGVGDPVERDIFVDSGTRVVLVEGNYLLLQEGHWALLRPLFSEAWFLDIDLDEAVQRVEDRHVSTGNSRELARFRAENNDRPNAVAVMATKEFADLVVPSISFGSE